MPIHGASSAFGATHDIEASIAIEVGEDGVLAIAHAADGNARPRLARLRVTRVQVVLVAAISRQPAPAFGGTFRREPHLFRVTVWTPEDGDRAGARPSGSGTLNICFRVLRCSAIGSFYGTQHPYFHFVCQAALS